MVESLFRRFGHSDLSADVRARTVYLTQIGYISMQASEDLPLRLAQHRSNALPGFTSNYRVHMLVHFELLGDMERAILREKQLKGGSRRKKLALIEALNPDWQDLYEQILQ